MRRYRKSESDSGADINLTPMIDVIFIMLIFFIVTASFVKESGIEVNSATAQTAVLQENAVILVAIDAENNIWIQQRNIDSQAVRAHVERLHMENPQGTVVIQADKKSSNGKLIEVMDQIRQAGIQKIAIATRDK